MGAKRESGGAWLTRCPALDTALGASALAAVALALWRLARCDVATLPQVGWQSARFCDYPQELGFQFAGPVHLMQLQV